MPKPKINLMSWALESTGSRLGKPEISIGITD
jgi:hypothetical protein